MKLKSIFILLSVVSSFSVGEVVADNIEKDIPTICEALDKAFQKRKWGSRPCREIAWKESGKSIRGRPLMYYEFGPVDATNVTLIFSMVHGDEITPLYVGFEIAHWAIENMKQYPKTKLILAPLVNPDGFLDYPKSRLNARGVDCNRNFRTQDWERDAIRSWKKKFNSDKRRFPGTTPDSEPETLFQKKLIEKFNPNKIVSIHSPLNVIDYDGPDSLKLADFSDEYIQKCIELRKRVKAKSTGFFPGSLGNYSGQELGIPTITLELPTAQAEHAKKYWNDFKKGIVTAITYEVPPKSKD